VQGSEDLRSGDRRLIVCIYLDDPHADLGRWQMLIDRPFRAILALETDETRWAIVEVART
jgi:hypothetical protein